MKDMKQKISSLIAVYWRSHESRKDKLRLLVVIALVMFNVYLATLFNSWKNDFYTSLENYNYDGLIANIITFCKLAAVNIFVAMYSFYLEQTIILNWRKFMSLQFIDGWLQKERYYVFTLETNGPDNPDQRIGEDIRLFIEKMMSFLVGIINACLTFVMFAGILWRLSGVVHIGLGNISFMLSGYIVWGAIAYAVLGTYITHIIGWKLNVLNYCQQRLEADFRYAMMRLQEYSEQIMLYKGIGKEKLLLTCRLNELLKNFKKIIAKEQEITAFKTGYFQTASIIPVLFGVPLYLSHRINLGGLMQSASAFSRVTGSLLYFVRFYTEFSQWVSCVNRLYDFQVHWKKHAGCENRRYISGTQDISMTDLILYTPQGIKITACASLKMKKGENILLKGENGSGKSSFLKALAGSYPYYCGKIACPLREKMLFLSQKPYLPLGTLGEGIVYPFVDSYEIYLSQIEDYLEYFSMEYLKDKLDKEADWGKILSLGEQQKIAAIRACLRKPEWLFLDESTSNMDADFVTKSYELFLSLGITIISVGHDKKLERYHQRFLRFGQQRIEEG